MLILLPIVIIFQNHDNKNSIMTHFHSSVSNLEHQKKQPKQ